MKRAFRELVFLFLLSQLIGFAVAAGPDRADAQEVIPLEGIVVTAPRIEAEVMDVPASMTVITREEIDAFHAVSIVDLLSRVTASNVLDETGNGNTQHIGFRAYESWRGMNSVVMFNGIPLRNFFNVPIEPISIERIEIIRGPSSVVYGGRVAGGVINIVTRTGGAKKFTVRPEFSTGSFGLRKLGLFVGGTTDRVNYQVSGLYRAGNGFRERNSEFEVLDFSARLVQQLDDRSLLSLNLIYWDGDKQFPGGFADLADLKKDLRPVFTDPVQEWPQRHLSGNVSYEGRFTPAHSVEANFFFGLKDQVQILDFRRPGAPDPNVRKSIRGRSNLGFVGRYRYERGRGRVKSVSLTGVDLEWDDFDNAQFEAPGGIIQGPPLTDQKTGNLISAVYVLQEVQPTEALKVSAGLRYERIDNKLEDHLRPEGSGDRAMDLFVPALGARYTPSGRVDFYGNIVRTFRPPQPQQLIDPIEGNQDLEPAISVKYELGTRVRPSAFLDFTLAGYYEAYEQDIVRIAVGTGKNRTQQHQNVGETERRGIEGEVRLRFAGVSDRLAGLSLFANGTLQKGEFSTHPMFQGNEIPYVPERLVNLGARYELPRGLAFTFGVAHAGRQWGDNNNKSDLQIPGYTVLHAVAGYEQSRFSVFLKMNNLLDEKYAVLYKPTLHGFLPGPPRHFEAGVILKLSD